MNISNSASTQSPQPPDYGPYFRTELACAIFFTFFSPVTVACNALLLMTLYKDPLKTFRIPSTYFVVALAVVDLLVGLLVEPMFAVFFFAKYSKQSGDVNPLLGRVAGFLSTVLLTSSFLLVLALTVSQYIAITYPHKYKHVVTARRVLLFIGLTWLYFVLFSTLPFTGLSRKVYYNIDLFLHTILISFLLVIAHVFLYKSYRRFLEQSRTLQNQMALTRAGNNPDSAEQEKRKNDQNFTAATLLLSAVLVLSAVPHVVAFCFFLYTKPETVAEEVRVNIALRIGDIVLFLKVAFNTFIYAWRLPRYRRALRSTVGCSGPEVVEERLPQNGPNNA